MPNSKKISPAIQAWIEHAQGKHYCHCGCDEAITVKAYHKYEGIPKYKHGHHRRGEKAYNHHGGWIEISTNGSQYKMCYNPKRGANGDTRKRVAVHRLVAEEALGRELETFEEVHHIDHNGLNNSKDNLVIVGRKYHSELHRREEILKYNRTSSSLAARVEAMNCFLQGLSCLIVMTPF